MVRNVWCHWHVRSWYDVELDVRAVVFGRVRDGERDCVVYLKRAVSIKEARELFGKAWKVEPLGEIISLRQALIHFGPEGSFHDAFDFIDHF